MISLVSCIVKSNEMKMNDLNFDIGILNEELLKKDGENISFKNEEVKKFYERYKNEIHSFNQKRLHKILDESNIKVKVILKTLGNLNKIVINDLKIEYIDHSKKENTFCIEKSKELFNIEKNSKIANKEKAEIIFTFNVDMLGKDKIGIYIHNKIKQYIYRFGKEKDVMTFLLG